MANKIQEWEPGTGIYLFFCPACGYDHAVHTKEANSLGAIWTWNGSYEFPTFSPSCLFIYKTFAGVLINRCHYVIREGVFEYGADCSHALAGKKIPMIDRK